MKTIKETLELALEALQRDGWKKAGDAIRALEEALAEQSAQQEPVAWIVEDQSGERLEWASDAHSCYGVPTFPLYTSPPAQHECSRSHPHENMDAMCELRTEIARLTNENARLKAQQHDPIGYLYQGISHHTQGKEQFSKKQVINLESRWWQLVGPVYTTPPQRTWAGLTDEEIAEAVGEELDSVYLLDFRAVDAKLKEKNT